MADKKDFSSIGGFSLAAQQLKEAQEVQEEQNTQETQQTQDKQEKQRKPRKRYTQEEAQAILEEGRNGRGLGGVKAPRINMAFTAKNYDFIVTLARMRGETATGFLNHLIDLAREDYKEQYEMAKKLKESF